MLNNITSALLGSIAIRYLSLDCSTEILSDPSGYLKLNGLENCTMLGGYCACSAYRYTCSIQLDFNIGCRLYLYTSSKMVKSTENNFLK